jgi:hypothetical protein
MHIVWLQLCSMTLLFSSMPTLAATASGLPLIRLSVVKVNAHESRNAFPDQF